jgi:hypothetical protein
MNYINPDHLYELNWQKIRRDQAFILKEEMLKSNSDWIYFLNLLGSWMISIGEKLRGRHAVSAQVRKLDFFQDASKILRS